MKNCRPPASVPLDRDFVGATAAPVSLRGEHIDYQAYIDMIRGMRLKASFPRSTMLRLPVYILGGAERTDCSGDPGSTNQKVRWMGAVAAVRTGMSRWYSDGGWWCCVNCCACVMSMEVAIVVSVSGIGRLLGG